MLHTFFFSFHRTQLFCHFDNLFWVVWCYFIKFVAEEGSELWSSPRTVWSGSRSWMWRQCLLLRFPYCLARIKNEVDGCCRNLLLQLFFSLPLGSAALFLCCGILSNYAAESYRGVWSTLWPPTRIQSLLKFIILCVLWCSTCLKVAAFLFFLSELTHVYTFNRVKTVCC